MRLPLLCKENFEVTEVTWRAGLVTRRPWGGRPGAAGARLAFLATNLPRDAADNIRFNDFQFLIAGGLSNLVDDGFR